MILVNSKQEEIARGAELSREKYFGVNVICISVILKRNKNIAENAHNFLAICLKNGHHPRIQKELIT